MEILIYFFAIVWIGSKSASAIPYDVIYDWKQVDYTFNTTAQRQSWLDSSRFIPGNNVISGIKVCGNRIFLSVPRWRRGVPSTLNYIPYSLFSTMATVGTISDTKLIPYPSWNLNDVGNCSNLQYVQSMEIDPYGRMWVADVGRKDIFEDVVNNTCPPKLVLIDLISDQVIQTHVFPSQVVSANSSFLNDIVVECENVTNCWAYMSDTGDAKVIVYNLTMDTSWFVRHEWMQAQANSTVFQIEGRNFTIDGIGNINGIALLPTINSSFSTLYYSPLSSYSLYSINTSTIKALLTTDVYGVDLQNSDSLGVRPSQSDGMMMDALGTLYYGLLGNNSIAAWNLNYGQLLGINQTEILHDDVQLQWVETFAINEIGDAFATTNRLQRFFPRKYDPSEVNFRVVRFFIGVPSYQYVPKLPASPAIPAIPAI